EDACGPRATLVPGWYPRRPACGNRAAAVVTRQVGTTPGAARPPVVFTVAQRRVLTVNMPATIGRPPPGRAGGPIEPGRPEAYADHPHRAVRQVDHLVRGTAEYQSAEIAAPARAHHDDADVVLLGVFHDLARSVAEGGVPHLTVGGDSRLGQGLDRVLDRRLRVGRRFGGDVAHLRDDLPFSQVQHPYLALRQQGQIPRGGKRTLGNIGVVHGHEHSLVHRGPPFTVMAGLPRPGGCRCPASTGRCAPEPSRCPRAAPWPSPPPRRSARRDHLVPGGGRWTCRRPGPGR